MIHTVRRKVKNNNNTSSVEFFIGQAQLSSMKIFRIYNSGQANMPEQNQDQVLLIPTDPREEKKSRNLKRWTGTSLIILIV